MGARVAVFCCMVSAIAACHVVTSTGASNLEVPQAPLEPFETVVPRVAAHEPSERFVRLSALHSDQWVALARAHVRTVPGSHCELSSVPLCNAWGQCQVGVTIAGEVCVLMVQVVSGYGQALEPYCHDLSSAEIAPPRAREQGVRTVLDRCEDGLTRLRDGDRFWGPSI